MDRLKIFLERRGMAVLKVLRAGVEEVLQPEGDFLPGTVRTIKWQDGMTATVGMLIPSLQKSIAKRVPDSFELAADKLHYLEDLDIVEVTLTKAPCVGAPAEFRVVKSEDGVADHTEVVPISKVDATEQIVGGYVTVPDLPDWAGSMISAKNVEKAAHSFMRNLSAKRQKGTGSGFEHHQFGDFAHPVESYVDRKGENGIKGGWWLETKITDAALWKSVEDGEIIGYSLAGVGKKVPVSVAKSVDEDGIFQRIWNKLKGVASEQNQAAQQLQKAKEKEEMDMELLKKFDMTPSQLEELEKSGVDLNKAYAAIEEFTKALKFNFDLKGIGKTTLNLMQILRNGSIASYPNNTPEELGARPTTAKSAPDTITKSEPDSKDALIEKLIKSNEDLAKRLEAIEKTRAGRKSDPNATLPTDPPADDANVWKFADGIDIPLSECQEIAKSMGYRGSRI